MLKRSWPVHSDDEIAAVKQVLLSGQTNYWTGSECRTFEKEFADYVGTRHAIALMNGTVALEAALYALEIGPGDEVITSSRTFIASASCVVMRGATPVIADVDSDSQNMTAATIAACITPKTKAIIVVHLAGWPADMPAIMQLAAKYQLRVIEDCAQAHGAMLQGRKVGAWGDVAAFSFCQDKIMTTGGEGGMVTTNDDVIWQKIWSFKDHGKNPEKIKEANPTSGFRWLHDSFGTNLRMTEMQAAIGRIQLKKLPDWLQIRRSYATMLTDCLRRFSAIRITIPPQTAYHAYYKYYAFIRSEKLRVEWNRDRIVYEMTQRGIPCFTGSCSEIYLEKAFTEKNLQPAMPRPIARQLGETSLMLQVDPGISIARMQQTVETLATILEEASVT